MWKTKLLAIGLVVVALTVAMGAVHGRWTNRWGHHQDLVTASKRLRQLPLSVGDWQATDDDPLDPAVVRLLQCAGSVNRTYANVKTGDRVTVMVLLGPSGPMSVHTPEICYSSREFRISQDRAKWKADEQGDTFWDLWLQANDVTSRSFRVLYGWTTKTYWNAAESPRFSYGGSSYVYKLQLVGPIPMENSQRDVCREFLIGFLPVLRNYLIDPRS